MDWLNILIFGLIPLLTVVAIFGFKRKLLWTSPLISTVLAFITYVITFSVQMNSSLIKIFSNNEWRGFFILAMLIHIAIVIVLTAIAYFISYILKRKQK